jgi:hypothetical protein
MITRDQLSIVESTAPWGGQILTVTVNDPPGRFERSTFRLRSPKGLDKLPSMRSDGGEWGYIVDELTGDYDDKDGAWHGATTSEDADGAIAELVEHLNELLVRNAVSDAIWSPRSELSDALDSFDRAFERTTPRDFRVEWDRVKSAVVAIDAAINSIGGAAS